MLNMLKKMALALGLALLAAPAAATIHGTEGTTFTLTAKSGSISTGDGNSVPFWGYALGDGTPQYPGPTLIVKAGERVTITLNNTLPLPVSMVFPGQEGVSAEGGGEGVLTREAPTGGAVTYSFTAKEPGTYHYHSGTRPDLQVEMGLVGALIVRPAGYHATDNPIAYDHADSRFDREYLFLLSEMNPAVHTLAAAGRFADIDTTGYDPVYWFVNGRTAPDTMARPFAPWLPTQPYNALPRLHPGEKLLMRVISAGRQIHPFHHHGNHALQIAHDGRLLSSGPGAGADLSFADFTIQSVPGGTVDALFEWTGKGLGWDIYGHKPSDPCLVAQGEDCSVHGRPAPVGLPTTLEAAYGAHYSGSPYLGASGALPPGEGGMNPTGGLWFMWHSHNEKEMTNYNIFPGGMMAMAIVEPPGIVIDDMQGHDGGM